VSADYPIAVAADSLESENAEAYNDAVVKAISKTNCYVTFACNDLPSRDLTAKVILRI
jgi:hypothetical protein